MIAFLVIAALALLAAAALVYGRQPSNVDMEYNADDSIDTVP